jgi:sugar phosphate isomerase/epimerase
MRIEQVAINSISTKQGTLPETLQAYADAGFRNIEMPFGHVKPWLREGHSRADLKALFDGLGLRFIGGFEAGVTAFGSAEERERNHSLHVENAEIIAAMGGGVLVVGTDGPEHKSLEALEVLGRTCAELVEQRFPDSVSLAIEFNWSPLVKSIKSAYRTVLAADHPRVGILFDPAHFYCTASKFEDLTPDVISRILHVHVDDMRDKPGDLSDCNSDRVLPGEGILDLDALFGRIEESGYDGYFSIELFNQEVWDLPTGDAARRCFTAMQRLARGQGK